MTTTMTMAIGKFTIRIVRKGDKYGRDFCLTHGKDEALVEFYDTRYPHTTFGQFVNRYYVSTILETGPGGLCLDGDIAEWSVSAEDMAVVRKWLALNENLVQATKDCERYSRPAHAVRNCPSDLQAEDMAWRRRKDLEFQIQQVEVGG